MLLPWDQHADGVEVVWEGHNQDLRARVLKPQAVDGVRSLPLLRPNAAGYVCPEIATRQISRGLCRKVTDAALKGLLPGQIHGAPLLVGEEDGHCAGVNCAHPAFRHPSGTSLH